MFVGHVLVLKLGQPGLAFEAYNRCFYQLCRLFRGPFHTVFNVKLENGQGALKTHPSFYIGFYT